jgi:flagellar hook-associated protein 2
MSSTVSSSTTSGSTSSASAANTLITSTGIGSGLNVSAIVSALTSSEGAAQQTQITDQKDSLTAQLSAFGTFSSSLSTLQATLSTLETPGTLAGFTATVGDSTVASASADSTAVAGQYTLAVTSLATAANLTSAPVANGDTAIGTGSLKISIGGKSSVIQVNSTNDTLSGIAGAINSATDNPGVSASVISTASGSRLLLSGTSTGAANAITVTETDGGNGLSSLVYDPLDKVTNLTQTQAAADASFSINGFAVTSPSNVVSNAISGVTLNLLAPSATGASTTVSIAPDTSNAATSVGTFVSALNGVISSIQSLTGYDPTTQTAGTLNGDPTLQGFQNQLEQILDTINSSNSGGITSLASLGITADANSGTLVSDSGTLGNALSASVASVAGLFGGSNGIATQINNLINSYTGPGGLLTSVDQGLQAGLTNVATQQSQLTAMLSTYSATLTTEYNAMDTAVASLKQTETYLTAEFNAGSTSSSSSTSSLSSGSTST